MRWERERERDSNLFSTKLVKEPMKSGPHTAKYGRPRLSSKVIGHVIPAQIH